MTAAPSAILGVEILASLCAAPPGSRIHYGDDPLQFGELSLPAGSHGSGHPVVINVHGGCWLSEYPIDHSRALASALAESGFAVWNIEYRRVGDGGGGWPGTFEDVANATDFLRKLAQAHRLDLTRVVLMGHSAGGQLALWLACRKRIPRRSILAASDPLPVRGVVALAPATELVELHEQQVYDGVIGKLLGGSPQEVPEH
ncbi:MAG: alpha/beta fold hydrolase, partial [Woeseiaceae bacterium]